MKTGFLLLGSIVLAVLLSGCILPWGHEPPDSECFARFIVSCSHNSAITMDKIPCLANADCTKENMATYCKPGHPGLAVCPDTNYYCGDGGFCKGCNCVE